MFENPSIVRGFLFLGIFMYMNIEQYKERFFNLMESKVGNVKPLILETDLDLNTMTIYWTTCGGDNVELSEESKKKLKIGEIVNGKQTYYFGDIPNDKFGEYEIMECLGPEIGKNGDLLIDEYQGKQYLSKNY